MISVSVDTQIPRLLREKKMLNKCAGNLFLSFSIQNVVARRRAIATSILNGQFEHKIPATLSYGTYNLVLCFTERRIVSFIAIAMDLSHNVIG